MIIEEIKSTFIRRALGYELWRVRKKRNLRLDEAAKLSGIPQKLFEKCEQGKGVPVYIWLKIIAFYKQKIKIRLID